LKTLSLILVLFTTGLATNVSAQATPPQPQARPHAARTSVPVAAVAVDDGDTIQIRWNGQDTEIVRLLGIDTPETRHVEHDLPYGQPFGEEARAFALGVMAQAGTVEILRAATVDPYGRTLAYLFVDGRNYSLAVIGARLAIESVTAFGDNGFPKEAAAVLAAAKAAGPVAFEPPHIFRARMRTVTAWMKARGVYPP
jgi:micrococcal nuclease